MKCNSGGSGTTCATCVDSYSCTTCTLTTTDLVAGDMAQYVDITGPCVDCPEACNSCAYD